ncbi:MAG: type II toxin-antitoxin system RelE/ParE family toxin [Pirellulales bacterium]|nr:type II toxin-antitoxin system RelE/ParE family toxin [Pirellulales bacterium]
MSYSIRILPVAKVDRRRIFRYIESKSPQGAESWDTAYEKALLRLKDNPLLCGIAPESEHLDIDLRQLLFKTRRGHYYRLLFRVDGEQITIYRVRGQGQDYVAPKDLPNG